jgi:elongation factor Tu
MAVDYCTMVLPSPALDPSRPHINVAILGHSGHGKSRLAVALTERSFVHESRPWARNTRRIVYVDSPGFMIRSELVRHNRASVIEHESPYRHYSSLDVPGARRLSAAALSAAGVADVVVLVVSAMDGALAQTREHALYARALGIPHIIVFVSHCDVVSDSDQLDLAENDVREVLTEVGYAGDDVAVIRGALGNAQLSERWQATVDDLIATIDRSVQDPARDAEDSARATVLWRYDVAGQSRIALVHMQRGMLRKGDRLAILYRGRRARVSVEDLRVFDRAVEAIAAGDIATIKLAPLGEALEWRRILRRGAVLSARDRTRLTSSMFADLRLLTAQEGGRHNGIFSGHRGYFCCGSTGVPGRIVLPPGKDTLRPGEEARRVIVDCQFAVPLEFPARFVLRDGTDGLQVKVGGAPKWFGTCATGVLTEACSESDR